MNNNLTWKISTGVLAVALVAINVVAPAYEQKKSDQVASKTVEFLGGYETATPEEKQVKLSNAMSYFMESTSKESDARADFQASNGAYTTGDCEDFLVAMEAIFNMTGATRQFKTQQASIFMNAYFECGHARQGTENPVTPITQ